MTASRLAATRRIDGEGGAKRTLPDGWNERAVWACQGGARLSARPTVVPRLSCAKFTLCASGMALEPKTTAACAAFSSLTASQEGERHWRIRSAGNRASIPAVLLGASRAERARCVGCLRLPAAFPRWKGPVGARRMPERGTTGIRQLDSFLTARAAAWQASRRPRAWFPN